LTGEALPVIPFALDAVFGLVTLGALLVFLVCLGLREGWDHTIGYGLRWVAGQIRGVTVSVYFWSVHPLDFLADALEWIANEISHWLAVAALNSEHAASAMWHLTARVFWWSVHETKALAIDTWHALEHTVTVTVPDAAKWARREAVAVAHRLVNIEAEARRSADRELEHLAHVAEADALHGLRTAEHALDWSEAEVGALGRELGGLKAKLEQIARQLSPAAIVALIGATIFTDFGLGWLRCGNVGRIGRALCGLPSTLFNDLLALFADVYFVTAICELLPLIEEAYSELGTPLVDGITAVALEVCASPDKWPADPPVPALHLPAVVFDGALYLAA
jgi:hypothetical protein